MSDEIYLSDNEDKPLIDNDMFPPLEDDIDSEYEQEEMEYMKLINEKILNKINNNIINNNINYNINNKQTKTETKPKKQQRVKNILDLSEKPKEEKKTKKWISKRMENKKEPEYIPRKFNPRFPPLGKKFN